MGMLHVKYLAPKIIMPVDYGGRQLAQRLALAAPAYHKKEDAAFVLERSGIACNTTVGLIHGLGVGWGVEYG